LTIQLDYQTWLSNLAIKLDYQTWLSNLAIQLGYPTWLSNLAIQPDYQTWLSNLTIKLDYQTWLSKNDYRAPPFPQVTEQRLLTPPSVDDPAEIAAIAAGWVRVAKPMPYWCAVPATHQPRRLNKIAAIAAGWVRGVWSWSDPKMKWIET
jgi:hypothetical protein